MGVISVTAIETLTESSVGQKHTNIGREKSEKENAREIGKDAERNTSGTAFRIVHEKERIVHFLSSSLSFPYLWFFILEPRLRHLPLSKHTQHWAGKERITRKREKEKEQKSLEKDNASLKEKIEKIRDKKPEKVQEKTPEKINKISYEKTPEQEM